MKMNPANQRFEASDLQQLYQYAMVLCKHTADAQDLLQSGIETYLSDINQGKRIGQPMAYVRQVIRNRFIDHYRQQQRWKVDSFEEQSNHDISPVELEDLQITRQTLEQLWGHFQWMTVIFSTIGLC